MDKELLKVKDLPTGAIILKGKMILGITKATLPQKYYDYYCTKVSEDNEFDYELDKRVEEVK